MMMHENEDTLMELALGLLEADAENRVRAHLQQCPSCLMLFKDVEQTLVQIKDVKPRMTVGMSDLYSLTRNRYAWIRAAAVLVIGFGLGYVVSESLHSPPITTVRQLIVPRSPELLEVGFVACDEVDLMQEIRMRGQ